MVYNKTITGKNQEKIFIMTESEFSYHKILNDEKVKPISRATAKEMLADFFDESIFKNVLVGVSYIVEGDNPVTTDNVYSEGVLDLSNRQTNSILMGDPLYDKGLPSGKINNSLKGQKIIAISVKVIPLAKKGKKKFKTRYKSKYNWGEVIEE